jgi:hypothetical protein
MTLLLIKSAIVHIKSLVHFCLRFFTSSDRGTGALLLLAHSCSRKVIRTEVGMSSPRKSTATAPTSAATSTTLSSGVAIDEPAIIASVNGSHHGAAMALLPAIEKALGASR